MRTYEVVRRLTWSALVVVLVVGSVAASTAPDALPAPTARTVAMALAPMPAPARQTTVADPPIRVPVRSAALRPPRSDRSTQPVRLEIAGVGIAVPVVAVGVTERQTMALPETVYEAGWYRFGPRPADGQGSTVIAAHVDTVREGVGPFAKLFWVAPGTRVAVTDDSGRVTRYRVRSVDLIPRDEVPLDRVFTRIGPAKLVLITCGGAYSAKTGYRDNVVVTAEPG